MILIYIIILAILFWVALRAAVVATLVHEVRSAHIKEWIYILLAFLSRRSERALFYRFMVIEAGLAGVLPQIMKAQVSMRTHDKEVGLWLDLCQNSEWVSLCIAVIIAIGYYLYLWLSNRNSSSQIRELVEASRLINEEYNFIPTQSWFEKQNEKARTSLGKRYSEERNFRFENMDFALAALRDKDDFKPLLQKYLQSFDDAVNSFASKVKNKAEYNDVENRCLSISQQINALDGTVVSYTLLLKESNFFLNKLDDFYFHSFDRSDHDLGYAIRNIREKGNELINALDNEWITFKEHHTIIITGFAGIGKSHLIGDIIAHRKIKHEPSILLLGQHFTTATDPLSQIKDLLDIRCRKERLLQQLNNYGKRNGKPVVIFIDAINEGAGDELWNNFLTDLITELNKHKYLRLVISFRISNRKNWFYDLAHDPNNAVYHHKGFKGHEREACEYIFTSFGLDQPLWPVYGEEFSNPLFLIKYCRNHERSGLPLVFEDFWTTIKQYCVATNHELSNKFGYNEAQDLVTGAMRAVAELMVNSNSRWRLEYETVMAKLTNVAQYTRQPKEFFDLLIDEGLLRTEQYKGKAYVSYGYERIGDYFIAENLVNTTISDKWLAPQWGDLDEALSVIVPSLKQVELIELVKKDDREQAFHSFINSAAWRDSFCDKGHDMIEYLNSIKDYHSLFNLILSRPFRSDNYANGESLYNLLWNISMAKRDEIWTIYISEEWDKGKLLMNLARWGCEAAGDTIESLSDNIAKACTETLIWSFSSTWRTLRDTATHALVNILAKHNSLILPILKKFNGINDPYIDERLWCSVYGAILLMEDPRVACSVAEWVYQNIFVTRQVAENILVRDYTRNIVVYAQTKGLVIDIDRKLINVPFTNGSLPKILSYKDIEAKYDRDWQTVAENERKEYLSQNAILSSMATEHSLRTSMYGDFGRYVFQSNIDDFGEDVELMSNWGIQMIFEEYGYNAKIFSNFDYSVSNHDRSHAIIERIGKKYQWIAMYRIMARLMDRYPENNWEEEWSDPIRNARNIDPTIYPGRKALHKNSKYEGPKYNITKPENDIKWLKAWKSMPKMKEHLIYRDGDGTEWINLFSYNTIIHRPNNNKSLKRDLWTFIQAYITEKDNLATICKNINKYGIQGRSFHENREVYGIFSREFFWSDVYNEAIREDNYCKIPFSIGHMEFDNILIEPAYLQYQLSSDSDSSFDDSISMLIPNECLYNGLCLHYSKEDGVWVNEYDEIIVLDNSVYSNGHRALLVRKDVLQKYLNQNNKCIFWPILNERMTQSEGIGYASHVQSGGWAYMDENGKIHEQIRCYELTEIEKKWRKWKGITAIKVNTTLLWLHKHSLIWLPKERKMKLYLGKDYNWYKNLHIQGSHAKIEDYLTSLSNNSENMDNKKR